MKEIAEFKSILELAIAIAFFIRLTWQMSEMKSAIYMAIDKVADDLTHRLNQIEKRFEIHLNNFDRTADLSNLVTNQLRETIEHRFKRLYSTVLKMEAQQQRSQNGRSRDYCDLPADVE